MNRIKLALGVDFPFDTSGPVTGPAAVSISLLKALAKIPEVEIHVVSCNSRIRQEYTEKVDNFNVHRIPSGYCLRAFRAFTVNAQKVRRVYQEINPDIIHSQSASEYVFGADGLGIPVVLTLHGVEALCSNFDKLYQHSKFLKRVYLRRSQLLQLRSAIRKSTAIIAISKYSTYELTKLCENKKVYVVCNPVRKEFFESESQKQSQANLLLYMGYIMELKNLIDLVKSFDICLKKVPSAKLHIAGRVKNRMYYELLQSEIQKRGLRRKIEFLGELSKKETVQAYRNCSILVLPSLQETTPVVIAEAMVMGKPVVATEVGGIPEMIEDGKSGYLVEPGDVEGFGIKLSDLLLDGGKRERFGRRSRQIASEKFSPDKIAKQTLQVYKKVIAADAE